MTSRNLTSRRWTRADPPRIGRVKRNVRTPSDPSQPAGAPSTETAVTPKTRFMPKRPAQAGFGDTTPWCRSPAQPPLWASPVPELARRNKGFWRVGSHHASPGSVLGASTRGRPRAHRQRCLLSRRWALAASQRRTIRSTRGRWAVTLRHQQFGRTRTPTAWPPRTATNGHRPERCDRVTDRRALNETTIPGGVRHRSDLGPRRHD